MSLYLHTLWRDGKHAGNWILVSLIIRFLRSSMSIWFKNQYLIKFLSFFVSGYRPQWKTSTWHRNKSRWTFHWRRRNSMNHRCATWPTCTIRCFSISSHNCLDSNHGYRQLHQSILFRLSDKISRLFLICLRRKSRQFCRILKGLWGTQRVKDSSDLISRMLHSRHDNRFWPRNGNANETLTKIEKWMNDRARSLSVRFKSNRNVHRHQTMNHLSWETRQKRLVWWKQMVYRQRHPSAPKVNLDPMRSHRPHLPYLQIYQKNKSPCPHHRRLKLRPA